MITSHCIWSLIIKEISSTQTIQSSKPLAFPNSYCFFPMSMQSRKKIAPLLIDSEHSHKWEHDRKRGKICTISPKTNPHQLFDCCVNILLISLSSLYLHALSILSIPLSISTTDQSIHPPSKFQPPSPQHYILQYIIIWPQNQWEIKLSHTQTHQQRQRKHYCKFVVVGRCLGVD